MKIIADQGSPEFWLLRANEFISEIRDDSKINEDAINKLNKILGLIALTKVHYDGIIQSKRKPKLGSREQDPGSDNQAT